MMLVDKSYFDYDYKKVDKLVLFDDTVKSDEEAAGIAAMFGIGTKEPKKTE